MLLLTVASYCTASPQAPPVTVRQHVLAEVGNTDHLFKEKCTTQYPTLEASFEDAIADHQLRAAAVLDALLESDNFMSLAQATAPEEAIAASAESAAFMRNVTFTQQDCNRILSDVNGASDETLKAVLSQMLVAIKGMIDFKKPLRGAE
jgi:hypothetical protein